MNSESPPNRNGGHQTAEPIKQKNTPSLDNRSASQGQEGPYEDRRNAAACFRNKNKTEDFHPAYVGVMVVEGFKDGDKLWVNVHVRMSRTGEKYVSVVLKPQRER